MAVVSIATLKSYFETADVPTAAQFIDVFDTLADAASISTYLQALADAARFDLGDSLTLDPAETFVENDMPLRNAAGSWGRMPAATFVSVASSMYGSDGSNVPTNYNAAALAAFLGLSTTGWKQAVRVASTANGTLATAFENGDTVDGVVLATGDRILLKNQTAGAENGIYVVAASGAPARSTDADSGAEMLGAAVLVSEGTTNADTCWICTTNATITIGATALVFAAFGNSGFTAASTTEVLTGTDVSKGVTADALASLWEKGSDVASAGTTSLGEGGFFHITGTTTITDIDFATDKSGRWAMLVFDGALILTHNASTLILAGGANITTAAGDMLLVRSEGTDVVRGWHFPALAPTGTGAAVRATSPTLVTPALGTPASGNLASCNGYPESIIIAVGDEGTALTAGTAKITFRMPYAFTLTAVRSSVKTAPTGATLIVDINEGGTTILSTKLSIDATEKTSTTAASAAVISDASLADDAEITMDIDQIGSTIAGAGLKVALIGHRT